MLEPGDPASTDATEREQATPPGFVVIPGFTSPRRQRAEGKTSGGLGSGDTGGRGEKGGRCPFPRTGMRYDEIQMKRRGAPGGFRLTG